MSQPDDLPRQRGGVAGGDEARFEIAAGAGATATISSVAAERVYRAHAEPARLSVSLALAAASRIDWLPQETILYAGARLVRRVDVALAADAAVTLLDILVLGRRGSGERMVDGALDDRWTIRRGDRLVHMEAVRLEGAIDAAMQRSAVGSGAHVIGTLVHVAPDTEDKLDGVRAALGACGDADVAASAWQGKLVIRALGSRSDRVRQALAAAASCLSGRRMPQVWAC